MYLKTFSSFSVIINSNPYRIQGYSIFLLNRILHDKCAKKNYL